jgi:hypothetical protein
VPLIDIVIRTWFRDFRWLALSLRSILRLVEGYRRIVVVMPGSSLERLPRGVVPATERITVIACPEFANDYLGQQITKLHADEVTDAPLIVHVDSDCIFQSPCALRPLLIKDGRPILRGAWRPKRQLDDGWRRCVIDFYGQPLPFDAVVAPPMIFPASLYRDLRLRCRAFHQIDITQWALSRQIDTLSEYGILCGEAWFARRDDFYWANTENEVYWPCRQYWSHSPKAADIQRRLESELA